MACVVRALDGDGSTSDVIASEATVTVVSHRALSTGERALVRDGRVRAVIELREDERRALSMTLITEVEEALRGRRVIAYVTACYVDPDLLVDTFVFEPL